MQNTFRRYLIRLGFITIFSGVIALGFYWKLFPEFYLNIFPFLILFFFITHALTNYLISTVNIDDHRKYINRFLLSSSIKLLTYLLFILVYLFFNREKALLFVIPFFILYLIFTSFEVTFLTGTLKKNKS